MKMKRKWNNPVLSSELKTRMRGWKTALGILFYLGALLLIGFLYYLTFVRQSLAGDVSVNARQSVGTSIYTMLAVVQFVLILLITPAQTAGSISGEREKQTLDMLLATQMSPFRIVFGKLLSSMSYMILLIFTSLPLFSLVFLFGGVTPGDMAKLFLFYIITVFAIGSIGIFFSALLKRTVTSTVLSYLCMFLLGLISVILGFYLLSLQQSRPNPPPLSIPYVLYVNPAVGLADILMQSHGGLSAFLGSGNVRTVHGPDFWMGNSIVMLIIALCLLWISMYLVNPIRCCPGKRRKRLTRAEENLYGKKRNPEQRGGKEMRFQPCRRRQSGSRGEQPGSKEQQGSRDLERTFAPVKRRRVAQHMLQCLCGGVLASLAAVLLLCILSFFVPLETFWRICSIAAVVSVVLSLIVGWATRPSSFQIACAVDRLGLQEKVMTALERKDRNDAFSILQRQDAISSLAGFDRKRMPMKVSKRFLLSAGVLAGLILFLSFLPNPMDRVIRQRHRVQEEVRSQLANLEETAEKELSGDTGMTEGQKQELKKLVQGLTDRLKNAEEDRKALKEISKTEEKLDSLTEKIREAHLEQLTNRLAASEETRSLAAALHQKEPEAVAEEIRKWNRSASDIGSSAEGQNGEAVREELGKLIEQAAGSEESVGEIKYALQQMRSKVAEAAGSDGSQYAGTSGVPPTESGGHSTEGDPDGQSGVADRQGKEKPENQEQGSGSKGQGQGNAAGSNPTGSNSAGNNSGPGDSGSSGKPGSGAGSGTTNYKSASGGSGSKPSGGNETKEKNDTSVYEQIYAPERLGDGGEVSHVSGRPSGSGDTTTEKQKDIGDFSGYIPYQDVYQEYRSEAMNSMQRRSLPSRVRRLVQDYFDALGQ